ncbi:MAG: hypothetical protein ACLVH8_05995 [Fusobacterium sp.]
MKKVFLICACIIGLTGCFEEDKNTWSKNGGFIATKADYIIINTTGNKILDIYKLKDCFVSENINTDGLNFKHPVTKSHITIQGDVKVLRNPTKEDWEKYEEYHADEIFCKNLKNERGN